MNDMSYCWHSMGVLWLSASDAAAAIGGSAAWAPVEALQDSMAHLVADKFSVVGVDIATAKPYAVAHLGGRDIYIYEDNINYKRSLAARTALDELFGTSGLAQLLLPAIEKLVFA